MGGKKKLFFLVTPRKIASKRAFGMLQHRKLTAQEILGMEIQISDENVFLRFTAFAENVSPRVYGHTMSVGLYPVCTWTCLGGREYETLIFDGTCA